MYMPLRNACVRMMATRDGGMDLYALAVRTEFAPGFDQLGIVQAISAETGATEWVHSQRTATMSLVATDGLKHPRPKPASATRKGRRCAALASSTSTTARRTWTAGNGAGRHPHPRHDQAPGRRHVRGRTPRARPVAPRAVPLLSVRPQCASGRLRCVEVAAAYYSAPPGWIGRRVDVQWDDSHVRLLDPSTGQLLREHLRTRRGWHRIADDDRSARTPPKTLALLAAAKRAGPAISAVCDHIHRHEGAAGVRRGVLSLAQEARSRPKTSGSPRRRTASELEFDCDQCEWVYSRPHVMAPRCRTDAVYADCGHIRKLVGNSGRARPQCRWATTIRRCGSGTKAQKNGRRAPRLVANNLQILAPTSLHPRR